MAEPTMLIDGQWVPAVDGDTYDRLSPFDGHLVSTYANGDSEDARRGIAAARAAFDAGDWRRAPVQERAAVLAAAARLRAERDRLARLLAEEIGRQQAGAVEKAAKALEYCLGPTTAATRRSPSSVRTRSGSSAVSRSAWWVCCRRGTLRCRWCTRPRPPWRSGAP